MHYVILRLKSKIPTRKELIVLCKERGISGYSKLNKAELKERLGVISIKSQLKWVEQIHVSYYYLLRTHFNSGENDIVERSTSF